MNHARVQVDTNGLGLAGFITSVIGLLTGGCLSPVGLLLSFIAVFKAPRGFAIAGLVIGLIGALGFILIGLLLGGVLVLVTVLGVAAVGQVVSAGGLDAVHTMGQFKDISAQVTQHRGPDGSFPTSLAAAGLASGSIVDPWGNPIEYTLVQDGRGFALTSAGPDGQLATPDDLSLTFDGATVTVLISGNKLDLPGMAEAVTGRK